MLLAAAACALAACGESGKTSYPDGGTVPDARERNLADAVRAARCEFHQFEKEGDGETDIDVDYRSDPPHSGPQSPRNAGDGVYMEAPTDPELVHTLRHGRVVLWLDPDLPEKRRGQLKALHDEDPFHELLVPDSSMPYEIAATTWTRRLTCKRLTDRTWDALRAFRTRYRDKAPEFVP